jgi:hypothetical protein
MVFVRQGGLDTNIEWKKRPLDGEGIKSQFRKQAALPPDPSAAGLESIPSQRMASGFNVINARSLWSSRAMPSARPKIRCYVFFLNSGNVIGCTSLGAHVRLRAISNLTSRAQFPHLRVRVRAGVWGDAGQKAGEPWSPSGVAFLSRRRLEKRRRPGRPSDSLLFSGTPM